MLKAKFGDGRRLRQASTAQKKSTAARLLLAVRPVQDLGRPARRGAEEEERQGRGRHRLRRGADHPRRRPSRRPSTGAGRGSSKIRKALDEAARDDSIKAVVLRVNSPGGSAVASEIILDATRRVKAKKPFVVSMGDVAGSGGYYVACASDIIFADESTITGSIGVVAGKLATTEMWDKVGVTFKAYAARRERRHARLRPGASRRTNASGCRPGWTRSTASSRGTSRPAAATG